MIGGYLGVDTDRNRTIRSSGNGYVTHSNSEFKQTTLVLIEPGCFDNSMLNPYCYIQWWYESVLQ